jgi:hypothetical protein
MVDFISVLYQPEAQPFHYPYPQHNPQHRTPTVMIPLMEEFNELEMVGVRLFALDPHP